MVAPIPTFIPQDSWNSLTVGGIEVSVANSVPNATFLAPTGAQDGLVGPADGALVYLAGTATKLDGGQAWIMWDASSMRVADGLTVFNPFALTSTPGRWINTGQAASAVTVQVNQTLTAGGSKFVAGSTSSIINVFIKGRSVAGATSLFLPASTFVGQTCHVKDANGDAGTSPINIQSTVDGGADSISNNYGASSYVWNGSDWSKE